MADNLFWMSIGILCSVVLAYFNILGHFVPMCHIPLTISAVGVICCVVYVKFFKKEGKC